MPQAQEITSQFFQAHASGRLASYEDSIVKRTGPQIWTRTILQYLAENSWLPPPDDATSYLLNCSSARRAVQLGDVVILPVDAFSGWVGGWAGGRRVG